MMDKMIVETNEPEEEIIFTEDDIPPAGIGEIIEAEGSYEDEPEEEIIFTEDDIPPAGIGEIIEPPYDFLPEEIDESDPESGVVK